MNSPPSRARWDPLVAVSLIAGVGFTAIAEYQLARKIGSPVPVAVLLPVALDVYVVAAIRRSRGRDIALALLLMGVAQVSAHMLEAGVVEISVPLVAAVSVLVPLVIWRVHALAVLPKKQPAGTGTAPAVSEPVPDATVERVPASAPAPVPPAVPVPPASRPELEAVPEAVPAPVPVRPRRPNSQKTPRSTAPKSRQKKTGTGSFDDHVRTAIGWLGDEPDLSGTAIGERLGTGDSYGRRVRREALAKAGTEPAPGPEHRDHNTDQILTGS